MSLPIDARVVDRMPAEALSEVGHHAEREVADEFADAELHEATVRARPSIFLRRRAFLLRVGAEADPAGRPRLRLPYEAYGARPWPY